jgi:hypothetical protein
MYNFLELRFLSNKNYLLIKRVVFVLGSVAIIEFLSTQNSYDIVFKFNQLTLYQIQYKMEGSGHFNMF